MVSRPGRLTGERSILDVLELAGQRQAHGLQLLGGELELSAALEHLLGVQARLIAMVDGGQHDPEREESSSASETDWRPDISL